MANLTNIMGMVQRSGKMAEKIAKKQLSKKRDGNKSMNTYGELKDSIEFKVDMNAMLVKLELQSADYGLLLDEGFTDIPFKKPKSKKPTKKKPSQYILGLTRWAAKKYTGGDWKAATKIAFAIAHKQKAENKAPANPGWITDIKEDIDSQLTGQMALDTMTAIDLDVESILNRKIP